MLGNFLLIVILCFRDVKINHATASEEIWTSELSNSDERTTTAGSFDANDFIRI
jgi:hypothetical protein